MRKHATPALCLKGPTSPPTSRPVPRCCGPPQTGDNPYALLQLAFLTGNGVIYGLGEQAIVCSNCGVERDLVEAYKWFSLTEKYAVYSGQREGAQWGQKQIGQQLSAAQLAEAKRRVEEWRPHGPACVPRQFD